jgi:hypothetical protein
MNTTQQAALLSADELDALRQQAGGALNFVTLREFRAIAKAVTPAILAKLQATQEPVQAGELPDERAAFELFAQNCPMGKYSIVRRDGGYDSSHTQIMWDAWQARAALSARKPLTPLIARQLGEWHEDDGPVMWWAWNGHGWAGEPAWCGQPTDSDWPGYHTHWTPHPQQPATNGIGLEVKP